MKIVHTEWSDGLGGQEKRVLAEAVGLKSRGHHVLLVCREHGLIRREAVRSGIESRTLPMRRPYDLFSILALRRFLRDEGVQVVNTHSGVDSWVGGVAAKLARVPVLVRTRHLNIPLKRNPLNFVHYLPDTVISCGSNMRDTLIRQSGFPEDRVVSIPTGVPSRFFEIGKTPALKVKYGLPRDSVVISNVGILRGVKGHEVTLQAVLPVVERYPNARFLLAGDGPKRRRLEKTVNELGISDSVKFAGFVEAIDEVYAVTDVSVLSSWSEGVPQSLLQSMAAGIPVVATAVGGVPEVVKDGETGFLVAPGDHRGLAGAIVRTLDDPEGARQRAETGRKFVMDGHSENHMLDAIEGLYAKLLDRKTVR